MILLILIWAVGINWFAYQKGFYKLPTLSEKHEPAISFKMLVLSFATYLLLSLIALPLIIRYFLSARDSSAPLPISLITGLQCFMMLTIFAILIFYFQRNHPRVLSHLWKRSSSKTPIGIDFGMGIWAWFLSFPIVTIISELVDKFMKAAFGLETYQQNAVKFVKLAMSQPASLLFALVSVLILAPFIEEFLFRGVLLTYSKKYLGRNGAILFSALCFAFFHFSSSQGLGNVSLIVSLFFLGGYLGFLYERQDSLWAPIGLHMAFNAVSALRILFFPESA